MKKITLSIYLLILCFSVSLAQIPGNRTSNTIVVDVLAQLPAKNQNQYIKMMTDLAFTGEDGVLTMVKMLNPLGKESNAQVEYALSGLSQFVAIKGREAQRVVVEKAYIKALSISTEHEIKAFIIRQLQVLGKDDSVEALKALLNDESLSDPAARALASINTPNAKQALTDQLQNASGYTKQSIVNAIGYAQIESAEPMLLTMLGSNDANLEKCVLYAISRCGTGASLKTLADAAEKTGYTMEKTDATEAYITLIKRVAENGDMKTAIKAASKLHSNAEKAQKSQTRIAALELLISIQKDAGVSLITSAVKDKDQNYRNSALRFATAYTTNKSHSQILRQLKKVSPEAKVDLLKWIGINRIKAATGEVFPYIKDTNPQIREAAVWAAVKIGGAQSLTQIANLIMNNDQVVAELVYNALSSFKGDVPAEMIKYMPKASISGKITALMLLADRKSTNYADQVFQLTSSTDAGVKSAAFNALKDVVGSRDFGRINELLLDCVEPVSIKQLQAAMIAAISALKEENRLTSAVGLMGTASIEKKYLYYPILASTGKPEATEIIIKEFNRNTGTSKDAAFEAMLNLKGMDAARQLLAICKDNNTANYRDKAFNAFVSIVDNGPAEQRLIFLREAMECAKTEQQKLNVLKRIGKTNSFLSLIYAGSFINETALQQTAANAVMNIALNNKEIYGPEVNELLKRTAQVLDGPDSGYQKEAISKHLANLPKEGGFISLFNGQDLTDWKGLVGDPLKRAKMTPLQLADAQAKADQSAQTSWIAKDGCLVFTGKGDNLCTKKKYGDFEMIVDWKLFKDSDEADAGIYLRGTPQVQIWDTARTNVGAQVGSGGMYNNTNNPSKPLLVADNKMEEWNTFHIKMIGERVTVLLNGRLVVDNVILENFWDRSQPIFPMEQIELQAHGSHVAYRNIYVKELPRTEPFVLSKEEQKEGFKVLFDGTSMHQWTGNTTDYVTENGTIVMHPSKEFGGNLYTKNEYGNFIYRFEFMLTPGANNGLGIRTPMGVDAAYHGMELQILDNEAQVYKDLEPYQYHGSVYGIIPAKRGFLKPIGEWNTQEVIANGDNIKVTVNGTVILDGNIREATKNGNPDKKEHPGLFNKKGHIGFLGHGSEVKFRNIRIKELK